MSLEDDIRIISAVELFENFSIEQLRLLAFGAERITVPRGRELYHEDQSAECGYVVVSGEIALFRETPRGRQVIRQIGPGMILGELALITETKRLTSAYASKDSVVIRVNRSLFLRMLGEYPEIASLLYAKLSARLGDMLTEIGELEDRFADK